MLKKIKNLAIPRAITTDFVKLAVDPKKIKIEARLKGI